MKGIVSLILILSLMLSLFSAESFAESSLPTASDISQSYAGRSHPYIVISPSDVTSIQQKTASDSWLAGQYASYMSTADALLSKSPVPYTHDGTHIDTTSASNASTLGFAYVITGDSKYATKAWQFAEAVCNYQDWNYSGQYLDTAEIAMRMGYVYDALYNYLSDAQKQALLSAIRQKGLDKALGFYDGTTDATCLYWSTNPNNWNIVCNGGVLACAAAIYDSDPAYCSDIISKGIASLEYAMPTYLPDGGFEEGSSYWSYATAYLVNALDAFRTAFDTDFGISQKYSLGTTAAFPLYMDSDGGSFSVGDAYLSQQLTCSAYYLALKAGNTSLASVIADKMKEYNKSGDLIFMKHYQTGLTSDNEPSLDASFVKPASGTFRQSWQKGGNYVAFHGGSNSLAHGDLDIGSFVFDSGGKRFVTELGRDDYYYPGYWDPSQRYTYYAKRGEGNNVLLINPMDKQYDQEYNANSEITRFESAELGGLGVLDTTEAYGTDVRSAKRGFMLSDNRRMLSIRDEVELQNDNNDIYWFAHTTSEIQIHGDGKSATLTIGNTKVNVALDCSEEDAVFSVTEPIHMSDKTKPADKYITNYQGIYKKLTVHTTADKGEFYLGINMALDSDSYTTDKLNIFEPISDWAVCGVSKPDASYEVLSSHKGTSVSVNDKIFKFSYPGTAIADDATFYSGLKVYAGTQLLTPGIDYKFLPVGSEIRIRFENPLMYGCRYKVMVSGLYDINGIKLASKTFSFTTEAGTEELLAISKGNVVCNKNILTITPSVYLSQNTTASVSCYVDDKLSFISDQYPYTCELTGLSLGTHRIRLVLTAFDKMTECTFDYSITDEYSIDITSVPSDSSKILYCENIDLRAEISDADYVEFIFDGESVASFVSAPYIHTLSTVSPGTHTFQIKAHNAFGSKSETVTFDVEGAYYNEGKKTVMTFDTLSPGDEVILASGVSYNTAAATEAKLVDGGPSHKTALTFESYNSSNYIAGFNDWSGYWYDAVKVCYDFKLTGNLTRTVHFTNFNGNYVDLSIVNGNIQSSDGTVYGNVETGRWYSVEIIADAIAKCAYVYIDGNLIFTQNNIIAFGSTFRNLNTYFTTGVKDSTITYDNYSLSNFRKYPEVSSLKLNSADIADEIPTITSAEDKVQISFLNAISQQSFNGRVYWTDGISKEAASYRFCNEVTLAGEACAYGLEISSPQTLAGNIKLVFDKGIASYPENKTSLTASDASALPQNIEIAFLADFPAVELESLTDDGTEFLYADNIELKAMAKNASKVEFFVDGTSVATLDSKPYVCTVSGISAGEHTLRVVASNARQRDEKSVQFVVKPKYRNAGKWVNMNFDSQNPGDEVSLNSGISLYGMSTCTAELADGGNHNGTAIRFVTTNGADYIAGFNDWTGYWHDAVKVEYDMMLSGSLEKRIMFPAFSMSGGTADCGVSVKNGIIVDDNGKEYGNIELDRWYKVEIIVDSLEQTYNLYIDSKLIHTETDISVLGSFLRNFNTYFTTGGVGSSIYFDNYGVSYLFKNPSAKSISVGGVFSTGQNIKLNPKTDKINIDFYNASVLGDLAGKIYWTNGTDTEPAVYTYQNTITHNNQPAAYSFEFEPPKSLIGRAKLIFESGIRCYPKNKSSLYSTEYGISLQNTEFSFDIIGAKVVSEAEFESSENKVSASAGFLNNSGSRYNLYAVIAAYSGNSLCGVSIEPYILNSGDQKTLSAETNFATDADRVNYYIWTNNMKPIYMKIMD